MITQCIQLHPNNYTRLYDGLYLDIRNHNDVSFGNQILWDKYNIYKLVEYVTNDTVAEHIVYLDEANKSFIPYVTRYIMKGHTTVYSHLYTVGICDYVCHGPDSDTIISPYPVAGTVFNRMHSKFRLSDPVLYDLLGEWKKHNSEIWDISPMYTFNKDNLQSDFTIYDLSTDEIYNNNKHKRFSYYGHTNPLNNDDIDILATNIGDSIKDVYQSVNTGDESVHTLTDALVNTFAPWKGYLYNDTGPIPQLSLDRKFVFEGISIPKLSKYSNIKDITTLGSFRPPLRGEIKDLSEVLEDPPSELSVREFTSLVNYITTINLTDFDITYKLGYIRDGILSPTIHLALNRYFPHDPVAQYSSDITHSFEEFWRNGQYYVIQDLEDKLGDWILTACSDDLLDLFDQVRLVRTYNEDLYIYFISTNDRYRTDAIHVDLIAQLLSSTNMCSKES